MVRPVQNHVIARAVESLESIGAQLGEVKTAQRKVGKRRLDICLEIVSAREVVGVPEHFDIGVKSLQCMLCVLQNAQDASAR